MDKLNMFDNKIDILPPPNKKTAGVNESGPYLWRILVFTNSWDTTFGRNTIVDYGSVVLQLRHGIPELLLFARVDLKNSPKILPSPVDCLHKCDCER